MKRLAFPLAAAFLAIGFAATAGAFSYQGALADASGNALQGNRTVEFRLYASETGDSALWGRACNVLLDENGMFNTEVADASGTALSGVPDAALDSVLAGYADKTLFLGLTIVGSSGEIAPRLRLLPVPYAVYAHDVTRASGDFAAAGKVTSAQLAVSGDAAFSAATTVSGNATVEGDLTVSGTVSGYGTVPIGTILLWSGAASNIPDGWKLCNGQNGTPDLRDRFVVGAGGGYSVGSKGGTATFTLNVNQLPAHSHYYAGDDMLTCVNAGITGYSANDNIVQTTGGYDASSGNTGSARIYRTSSVGSGASIENRPPYYALCYIMRVQ